MEFDNQTIHEILNGFGITRSLSRKGCPYDNAVAESTYKSVKVEFVHQYQFETLAQLRLELFGLCALVELSTLTWHVGV